MAAKLSNIEWTMRQIETMQEFRHQGAEGVQAALKERFGVERSIPSIQMQASRQGISLEKKSVCPRCDAKGVKLNKQTGLCKKCNLEQRISEEEIYHESLEQERIAAEESPEIEVLDRKYAMLRQRNTRFKRKHGLKTKKRSLFAKT